MFDITIRCVYLRLLVRPDLFTNGVLVEALYPASYFLPAILRFMPIVRPFVPIVAFTVPIPFIRWVTTA